ncbi:hypothetical protein [Nonomuraea sp. NPDC046570]|uniref:hypothetical protein n=1 Tax=Nonomuraea sp. NPDC046570 TaxID=3155255 RepID=UPI0033E56F35
MAEKITYYAILVDEYTIDRPAGLLRRREAEDGAFVDEGLQKDMAWHRTGSVVEWEFGNYSNELEEVSEEDARRIIEDLRVRWSALS